MKTIWARCIPVLLAFFIAEASAEGGRNLMNLESSPYLQLHADDLVHWRPWGEDALAEAERAGKPIFLSIGYLSCHWCHVMRRESFTDAATANLINAKFIPVLIDREEMPSLDSSFQSAAVLLGLASGWPLNLFLTPDGRPFWGGTYFPKVEIAGMPTFSYVLERISDVYRNQSDAVRQNADGVTEALRRISRIRPGSLTMDEIDAAAKSFAEQVNPFYGGFGDAPLFPMTVAQELLWRAYIRTGDTVFRDAVTITLNAMVRGGVYDHVGGGFFRYAVDPQWNVPHFEKMLNINAAMLRLMSDVWRETGDLHLKRRVYETVAFVFREMRLAGGAFASALDADSSISASLEEEEEGAFYVWDRATLKTVLGGESELFLLAFDLTPRETGEEGDPGTLHRTEASLQDIANTAGVNEDDVGENLAALLKRLFQARQARPRPRLDGKTLAGWNALMIAALSEAGLAFSEPDWITAAERAFSFIAENLRDETGLLHHSWTAGSLGGAAGLDDLAAMAEAAMALFEATGKMAYIEKARQWSEQAISRLWDEAEAGFFASPMSAVPQLVRAKPVYDDDEASGNARMIAVLARLYYLGGEERLMKMAETSLNAFSGFADEQLLALSGLLNAAETLRANLQIVVIGDRDEAEAKAMLRQVADLSLPNRTLQVIAPGAVLPEGHPARYKEQIDDRATAYVCRGTFCSLPATTRESLADTLLAMRRQGGSKPQ